MEIDGKKVLPIIPRDEYKVLYDHDWYDGPCSGMILWKDQKYWFFWIDEEEGARVAMAIQLSPEDLEKERVRHQSWVECCGNYCYDLPEGHQPTRPIEDYYTAYPVDSKSSQEEYIGKPVGIFYC